MRRPPFQLLMFLAIALCTVVTGQSFHRTKSLALQSINLRNRPDQNQRTWKGTYTYQEGGGRNASGATMFVKHQIAIYEQNGELIADIDANGYQTSRSLLCSTKIEGNRINLYFQSYREDNTFEPYRKGQFLLSLEKSSLGRRSRILTYWGAYQPAFRSLRSGRIYFRKTT